MKKIKSTDSRELSIRNFISILTNNYEIEGDIYNINLKEPIKIKRFYTFQPQKSEKAWIFLNQKLIKILNIIEENSSLKLEDISKKVLVGIKTTANYAFIDDYDYKFINKKEIKEERIKVKEKYGVDIFFPLIKGKMIRNFQIKSKNEKKNSLNYIFYPHYKKINNILAIPEGDIPFMINYLKDKGYDLKLKKREYINESNKNWYEIWNTRDPDDMEENLKIIVPDISPKNNFAIDYEGNYIDGSAYFIILKEKSKENYRYILGLLNSYIAEFYHKLTSGNVLYARRYRYWSSNIKKIPIILKSECNAELVKKLIEIVIQLENHYNFELEKKMNEVVFQIFNLDNNTKNFITKWVLNSRKGK